MNMSLLSSPLFQKEDSSKQRAATANATTTVLAGRQTTATATTSGGDEDTNLLVVVGGMEHESLLQDASLWIREMESIHDNLQMTSVRCCTKTTRNRRPALLVVVIGSSSCTRYSRLTTARLVILFSLHLDGWRQVQNAIILDSLYMTGAVEE
jgi:hypothetical protein